MILFRKLSDLFRLDLIEELACKPDIINPLSVSTRSSGKQRLILDLRHVNQFTTSISLNAKIWLSLRSCLIVIITCSNFILSLVITTLIFSRTTENFSLLLGILGTGFQAISILCAPFRAFFSPIYFSSILKTLQKSWRSQGIPIAIFLDDGLGGETDFFSAKVNSLMVHSDLLKSGFVPNEEKSLWEPLLVITWLGVILDTIDGTIQATDERIEKLNAGLVELLSCQPPWKVHVKGVAIVTGQIISLSPCVGSFARIMTRFLFLVVNSARSWESKVFL